MRTFTAGDLKQFLEESGIVPRFAFIPDALYVLPDKDWLLNEFARSLAVARQSLGVTRWEAESGDCDESALWAVAYAKLCHRHTKGRPKGAALAVGEFWYYSPQGPHAIIFAVTLESGQMDVIFIEPQNPTQLVQLTQKEKLSCYAYRL